MNNRKSLIFQLKIIHWIYSIILPMLQAKYKFNGGLVTTGTIIIFYHELIVSLIYKQINFLNS